MNTKCIHALPVIMLLCLPVSPAIAADIYVTLTGNDAWPGTSDQPKRTIRSANGAAASGDIIHVQAGAYFETYIEVKSGVTIVSEDGLYAAKVYAGGSSAFRFVNGCTNAEVRGFEVYAVRNGGASGQDGLVRAYGCSNIRIRDLLIHDAPRDADCVKIGGSGYVTTDILVEGCTIYNPANRDPYTTEFQECVDIYPATGVTLRRCWLYHTPEQQGDTLMYAKGGARNILWENCVFGPRHGREGGNCSTSAGGPSPMVFPSCENLVARNNLFLDCSGDAAFGLLSSRNVEFYNNIVYNYNGSRAPIEFWTNWAGRNENFSCYNNIFYNSNGKGIYSDRGYMPLVFRHDYNLYYQVPNGGNVNIYAEANSVFGVNPQLMAPSSPLLGTDTWSSIVARFRPIFAAPAIDAGISLGAVVPADINGVLRPAGPTYDIGPYEMVAGDADGDGRVGLPDLLILVGAFGSASGDAAYTPACDFNADGLVDVADLLDIVWNWET